MYRVPDTISSRVPGIRPGCPSAGLTARRSMAEVMLSTTFIAAPGSVSAM